MVVKRIVVVVTACRFEFEIPRRIRLRQFPVLGIQLDRDTERAVNA